MNSLHNVRIELSNGNVTKFSSEYSIRDLLSLINQGQPVKYYDEDNCEHVETIFVGICSITTRTKAKAEVTKQLKDEEFTSIYIEGDDGIFKNQVLPLTTEEDNDDLIVLHS